MRFLTRGISLIGFVSLLLTVFPEVGLTVNAVHYHYSVSDENTLDYWFAPDAVRTDYNFHGKKKFSTIYQSQSDKIVYLTPSEKKAQTIKRAEVKQLKQKMKTMARRLEKQMKKLKKRMKNMPPRQKKMMKRAMKGRMGKMADIKKPQNMPSPEFQPITTVTWNGMQARRGHAILDGDTRGEIIMLNKPPVSLSEKQRETTKRYQSILLEFMEIAKAFGGGLHFSSSLTNPENLFGTNQFRLAEVSSQRHSVTLKKWDTVDVSMAKFSVPKDYETDSMLPDLSTDSKSPGRMP